MKTTTLSVLLLMCTALSACATDDAASSTAGQCGQWKQVVADCTARNSSLSGLQRSNNIAACVSGRFGSKPQGCR